MAVIAFSDEEAEIWVMQRRVLAAILELAQSYLDDPSDRQTLVVAHASDGLHFDNIAPDRAKRLAPAVAKGVEGIRASFEKSDMAGERAFVPTLREIEERLKCLIPEHEKGGRNQ